MRTIKIPFTRLHRAHEVGPTAFLVYLTLLRRTNPDGECWPSIQRIADDLHMDRKSIVYALNTLEVMGWLSRRNRHGHATLYRVSIDGEPGPKNGPSNLVRKTDQGVVRKTDQPHLTQKTDQPPGPKNGPQKVLSPTLQKLPTTQTITRPPCGAPDVDTRGGYLGTSPGYRIRAVLP